MDILTFLVGPHLIGLLFIFIGLFQRFLPPKNINRWYGYRTLTAKSTQQAWDLGNRYSAIYMIRAGVSVLVLGFLIELGMAWFAVDAGIQKTVGYIILFGGAMGIGILSTAATERYLHKVIKIKKPAVKRRR